MSVFLTSSEAWLSEAKALASRRLGCPDRAHDVVMDCLLDCEQAIGRRLVPLTPQQCRFYFFRALTTKLRRPPTSPDLEPMPEAAPEQLSDTAPLVQRMLVAAHDHFSEMEYLAFVLMWAGLSSREVTEQIGISHSIILKYDRRVKQWLHTQFKAEWLEAQ